MKRDDILNIHQYMTAMLINGMCLRS